MYARNIISRKTKPTPTEQTVSRKFNVFTASSTAISSKGFMLCFTPSVTTPRLSGRTLQIKNHNSYEAEPTNLFFKSDTAFGTLEKF